MFQMARATKHQINLWFSTIALAISVETRATSDADFASLWTKLPVAAALESAKKNDQPALLYWGAVWCPPCNQLKSQVFSHPGFAAATAGFVRIYLDGDEPGAQEWAEKLGVSGYPTVLVLAPDQTKKAPATGMKEELRLAEFVNFDEFKALIAAALAESSNKNAGKGQSKVRSRVNWAERLEQRALAGKASIEDWRLIAYSWDATESTASPDPSQVKRTSMRLQKLLAKAPHEEIRGLLAARLLNLEPESSKALVQNVTNSRESLLAARGPFMAGAMNWITTAPKGDAADIAKQLLAAAQRLANEPSLSPGERLQATATRFEITNWLYEKKILADSEWRATRKEAAEIAIKSESESKSAFDRHAVVTDAAMLLAATGNPAKAKEILEAEAARSDTPWYYQSSLAMIHLDEKNFSAAMEWSAKARDSAKGHATRIQWLVSDLVLQSKIPLESRAASAFETGFRSWLDLAKSMPDGFSGRNALRAQKVKSALDTGVSPATKPRLVADWRATCDMLKKEARRNCLKTLQ